MSLPRGQTIVPTVTEGAAATERRCAFAQPVCPCYIVNDHDVAMRVLVNPTATTDADTGVGEYDFVVAADGGQEEIDNVAVTQINLDWSTDPSTSFTVTGHPLSKRGG